MKTEAPQRSGYRLERVHVAQQEYRVLPASEVEGVPNAERQVTFGWDWRALGPRRFEVVVEITIEPTTAAPEIASARVFGVFHATDGELSLPFTDFVRANAPAMLFPYAREVISTMTGRGPFGAFHVDPLNIKGITGGVSIQETEGHRHLVEHPDEAARFGLYDVEQFPLPDAVG